MSNPATLLTVNDDGTDGAAERSSDAEGSLSRSRKRGRGDDGDDDDANGVLSHLDASQCERTRDSQRDIVDVDAPEAPVSPAPPLPEAAYDNEEQNQRSLGRNSRGGTTEVVCLSNSNLTPSKSNPMPSPSTTAPMAVVESVVVPSANHNALSKGHRCHSPPNDATSPQSNSAATTTTVTQQPNRGNKRSNKGGQQQPIQANPPSTADSPPPRPALSLSSAAPPPPQQPLPQGAPPVASMSKKELKQRTLDAYQPPPPLEVILKKELEEKNVKIEQLQSRIAALEADCNAKSFVLSNTDKRQEEFLVRERQYREALDQVMQDMACTVRREARRKQHAMHFELGHIITAPSGMGGAFGMSSSSRELWVEGNRTRELLRKQEMLAHREAELELRKADLEKRDKALRKQGGTAAAITESLLKTDNGVPEQVSSTQVATGGSSQTVITDAIDNGEQLQALRRELEVTAQARSDLRLESEALDAEKKVFLKEIRRISEEDASEFATRRTMHNGQYVLIELLGKGGFSEVWKAFDLANAQYVALKIHKVGREMSIAQKQHYLRHAEREMDILRTLNHPRVTKLHDVFEPEGTNDTCVAVMEYCAGTDLDTFLKSNKYLKEADAKTIMLQMISALRHMADLPQPVIHYDLKPANILFLRNSPLCLEIKVTDFGLSKIMTNAKESASNSKHNEGIELTSQGTGTYWYLPPECFDTSRTPTINGKVDVWSLGVIFYQMLYGRRPYAEGVSQRQIWQDKLITQLAMKPVEFPSNHPNKVSEEAKLVIQRCLTASVNERCDIYQLSADPYFRKMPRGSGKAAGGGSGGGAGSSTAVLAGIAATSAAAVKGSGGAGGGAAEAMPAPH